MSLRGYAHARYNRLLESDERLVCTQCDRSLDHRGGIFLRRARVSVVARVTDRVQLLLQPDFTAESGEAIGMAQVRDACGEIALDRHHAARALGRPVTPYARVQRYDGEEVRDRRAPPPRARAGGGRGVSALVGARAHDRVHARRADDVGPRVAGQPPARAPGAAPAPDHVLSRVLGTAAPRRSLRQRTQRTRRRRWWTRSRTAATAATDCSARR